MAASAELLQLTSRHQNVSDPWFDKNAIRDEDLTNDGVNHEELLRSIKSLDKKNKTKRPKGHLRSELTDQVSEFHLTAEGEDGKVNLGDLVGSLQATGFHSKLKKSLESMQKMGKTVEVPLAKPAAERVQRVVAYQETSKEVSKWEPTVQKNRQAEHLSFPLNSYKPNSMSTGTLATTFKPRTPLEQEIESVLQNNSHMLERNNKELSRAEEEALKTMSLEEALERRKELQKLRALQSYYEQKCRRMKKIKSKKYHRIKRKAEKRATSKQSFEQLQKDNPELAKSELEKAERLRVAERMSLKHRNTSKWSKNIIAKGIHDVQARQAVSEQLRISRQLTDTKAAMSDSDDESEDDNGNKTEKVDNIRNFGLVGDSSDNPWLLSDGKTNSGNLGDQEKGTNEERIRKLKAVTAEETKDDDESELSDREEDGNHSEQDEKFEFKDESEVQRNTKKKKKKPERKNRSEKKKDKNVELEETERDDKEKKRRKNKESTKRKLGKEITGKEGTTKKRRKLKVKTTEVKKEDDTVAEPKDGVLLLENNGAEEVEFRPEQNEEESKKERGGTEDVFKFAKETANLNPKKVFRIEDLGRNGGLLDYADDSSDDEIRTQKMTIQEAFANDDVIEEFIKEKEDAVEAGKPKDLDLSLPGWGDWGGPGVDDTKRRKKFTVQAKPAPPRKDAKLLHVIINEERDERFAKNQVSAVPFPYTSREQWERSIRTPLGKHWNTCSVHQKLVKPRVTTLPGSIIEPMQPMNEKQPAKAVEESRELRRRRGKRRIKPVESGIKIHE